MSTSIYNPAALPQLSPNESSGRIWAYLIIENGTGEAVGSNIIQFLINPEELKFSRSANYAKTGTAGTSVQSQQFYNTEGRTLTVPNCVFETWRQHLSVETYLAQYEALLQPTIDSERWYAPSPLTFAWGGRQFGPCILTRFDWDENSWLAGQPASGKFSLTLQEIPPTDSELAQRLTPSRQTTENALDAPLTERQRAEGSQQAQTWLEGNLSGLDASLQERVQSNRYLLTTDETTGLTTITDEDGEAICTVGRWDGREFVVEDVQEL